MPTKIEQRDQSDIELSSRSASCVPDGGMYVSMETSSPRGGGYLPPSSPMSNDGLLSKSMDDAEVLASVDDGATCCGCPPASSYVKMFYLAIFAVLGTLLRIVLAQFFGAACANPGTVGWLAASNPLCVTADGQTQQLGGMVFADLPANLLGSFLMGFLQDGKTLGLAIPTLPIAWVTPEHTLQTLTILHLAWKTGFCGSLTTFSSWNAEMIVLLFGTSESNNSQVSILSQAFKMFFGYIIGIETALGSFSFGKTVAIWLHQNASPDLRAERKAMDVRASEGVFLHQELPTIERRYLADVQISAKYRTPGDIGSIPPYQLEYLERWRRSTWAARRVGHALLPSLIDIEKAAIIHGAPLSEDLENTATLHRWDLKALFAWTDYRHSLKMEGKIGSAQERSCVHSFFSFPVAFLLFVALIGALSAGVILLNEPTAYQMTDRTSCYSMLMAPFGAWGRWYLSGWNGSLPDTWKSRWFPIGTFTANTLAAIVSIVMVGLEYRFSMEDGGSSEFWKIGTLRAVRIGFTGCLSTVSTFVAEVNGFIFKMRLDRAYLYVLITLSTSCVLCSITYGAIMYFL